MAGEDVVKSGIATHFIPSDQLGAVEEKLAALKCADADAVEAILDQFDARTDAPVSYVAATMRM